MEKIAVAQEKADHFRASLEDPASLRVRAESQAPDGFQYPRARFPADLRAGIENAGNRSNADGGGLGDLSNRCFSWNCFHDGEASPCFRALIGSARDRDPFSAASLTHQTDNGIPAAGWRICTVGKKQENRCKILVS